MIVVLLPARPDDLLMKESKTFDGLEVLFSQVRSRLPWIEANFPLSPLGSHASTLPSFLPHLSPLTSFSLPPPLSSFLLPYLFIFLALANDS